MISTASRDGTISLGERIGRSLKAGDIVALHGDLGAGKTTLIQGIARGLGVKGWVTSPTFTIINEFKGRLVLYHIDLYRIDKMEDALEVEIEEYFEKGGVTVIEWSEKIRPLLPARTIEINIEIVSDNERKIKIKGLEMKK